MTLDNEASVTTPDQSMPSAAELAQSEGFELDDGGFAPEESEQSETNSEEMDHTPVEKTHAEMLEEMAESAKEENKPEESQETEETTDEKFILKHNDETLSYSKDEVTELAQKGLDYTKKTQALAEERKAWEAERAGIDTDYDSKVTELEQRYTEHNQIIENFNVLDHALAVLESEDPDTFSIVKDQVSRIQAESNTPQNKRLMNQLAEMQKEIKSLREFHSNRDQAEKLELVRKGFYSDLDNLKSQLMPKLQKIGLKPDWDKVEQEWIDTEASKRSVENAFWATHGANIDKLWASKGKVRTVQDKVAKSKLAPGIGAFTQSKGGDEDPTKGMNYDQMANYFVGQL